MNPLPLTAQEVEDALRGTKYEKTSGGLWERSGDFVQRQRPVTGEGDIFYISKAFPLPIHLGDEQAANVECLADAKLNAARAIILQRLVGELVERLEETKHWLLCEHPGADVLSAIETIDEALASARKLTAGEVVS